MILWLNWDNHLHSADPPMVKYNCKRTELIKKKKTTESTDQIFSLELRISVSIGREK